MTAQTPDQVAAAWAQRLGGATQKITAGVQAVTVAPGQAAARQKAVYAQNTAAAVDKWASRVAAVPLATWQEAVVNKGIPRIASGATAAQPKFAAFMGQLLPFVSSAVATLPPRGNLDQNINRMTAFSRKMATFKQSGQ
jgi:hypothetical protein